MGAGYSRMNDLTIIQTTQVMQTTLCIILQYTNRVMVLYIGSKFMLNIWNCYCCNFLDSRVYVQCT